MTESGTIQAIFEGSINKQK